MELSGTMHAKHVQPVLGMLEANRRSWPQPTTVYPSPPQCTQPTFGACGNKISYQTANANSLCHVWFLENAGCAHPLLHGSSLLYDGVLEDTELEAPASLAGNSPFFRSSFESPRARTVSAVLNSDSPLLWGSFKMSLREWQCPCWGNPHTQSALLQL